MGLVLAYPNALFQSRQVTLLWKILKHHLQFIQTGRFRMVKQNDTTESLSEWVVGTYHWRKLTRCCMLSQEKKIARFAFPCTYYYFSQKASNEITTFLKKICDCDWSQSHCIIFTHLFKKWSMQMPFALLSISVKVQVEVNLWWNDWWIRFELLHKNYLLIKSLFVQDLPRKWVLYYVKILICKVQ